MSSQRERWRAFDLLNDYDPFTRAGGAGVSIAAASFVLRDVDGSRLVRAGCFYQWVRTQDPSVSQQALTSRMARLGWKRRGKSGRIKATAPGRRDTLAWNFWIVPAGWQVPE